MSRLNLWVVLMRLIAILAALPLIGSSYAQQFDVETVSLDPQRMDSYLIAEAQKLDREAAARIGSRAMIEARRDSLYREFMFMIGLDPLPPRTPLQLTTVRTVERKDYTVEVMYYQSLPGFYVTANLYKPKKGKGPFPAVVWGPGHSADLYGAKALRQNYAIPWVANGYICMEIDPIQVAEVFGIHRGTNSRGMWDWFARGYTPIGIEVWNAMRAVDYLLTRPDVDGKKLTVNGVSGGGHLSWMAGAADDRFAVVQPVAGTANILTHVKLDLERMHCDCAYFINTYRHDWPTLAALIAPRPFLMHNSTGDSYYPPEGYKSVLERTKEIYNWFGVPEKTGMFEVGGPHAYTPEECVKAVEWSNRWLLGKTGKIKEIPFEEVQYEQLGALGGMYGEHPQNINARIQELLIPMAKIETYSSPGQWQDKREEIMDRLHKVVFRNLPAKVNWTQVNQGEHGAVLLETEPGIQVGVISYVPESDGPKQKAILYIASEGDTEDMGIWNFMKAYPFPGYAGSRHMVFPRGLGRAIWEGNQKRKFERLSMLLGRTLDEMRLYDILCAVDYVAKLPSFDGTELTVAGKGAQGILGAYAALLDPRITRVILSNPTLTHQDGPYFLNVLRYTDIPQALALLAPRELAVLTHEYEDLGYTRDIYKLLGAEDRFRRAYTVPQVLNLKK